MSRMPDGFLTHPAPFPTPTLRAIIREVIDGDTYIAEVDLGFNRYEWMDLRAYNINCPEIFHPKDQAELIAGQAARQACVALVLNRPVMLHTYKDHEKYGRYLATVFYWDPIVKVWKNMNWFLVTAGYAVMMDPKIPFVPFVNLSLTVR